MARIYTPQEFAARLRDFPVEARPIMKSLMDVAGQEGEALSKALVPVRTGALRDSIRFHPTTDHGWTLLLLAEAGMPYASYVEYGTSRMGPHPYFEPGVERAVEEIETALALVVEEYL